MIMQLKLLFLSRKTKIKTIHWQSTFTHQSSMRTALTFSSIMHVLCIKSTKAVEGQKAKNKQPCTKIKVCKA